MERPDNSVRDRAGLAQVFRHFGRFEAPQVAAPLYEELCEGIAEDPELLDIAAHSKTGQPAPNLLLGAVHQLLIQGIAHPLRSHYATLCAPGETPQGDAVPLFRDFCLTHRAEIEARVAKRVTQTNVIQRCTLLLPAFAQVFEEGGRRPLALIEVGCSAGLNLNWDRFHYEYEPGPGSRESVRRWGDEGSRVRVDAELRGNGTLPSLPAEIPVAWRRGIELHPIDLDDDDAVTWLRALAWPDHVGRQERLTAAIELARAAPPEIEAGDATALLPRLLEEAPPDATLCVYGTHTLYLFPHESLIALLKGMQAAGARRPLTFVSSEGTGESWSELRLTHYRGGERHSRDLARCSPHGRWLEWLA